MTVSPSPRVAVVGAGPAGLMAAETLAQAGVQVDVFDLRRSPGRKFVLAGRSGLNLTNDLAYEEFVARIVEPTGTVARAVTAFGPAAIRQWSDGLGEPTFVGSSGRVFPESFRATPLLRAWLERLDADGVTFHMGHRWTGWSADVPGALSFDFAGDRVEVSADGVILALGGSSWPRVGGDGSWVRILGDVGVEVAPLRAANAGILVDWSAPLLERFEGTPIKGVVAHWGNAEARGDLTITRTGLEGTPVYSLAAQVGRDLAAGDGHRLLLDLTPDRDDSKLDAHLESVRRERDSFATWMRRSRLAPITASLVREVSGNAPPTNASALAALIKAMPLPVAGVAPIERAISTAGGIATTAVGPDLQLTAMPGVFIAGEMLDADVPTGGWLLQVAFSTGVAAARGVLDHLATSTPTPG